MGQGTTRRSHHLGRSGLELVPHLQPVRNIFLKKPAMPHTLRSGVHDELRCEAKEDMLEEANCKLEAGPIVSVLKHLETVAIEVDIAVKVHRVESFHGNLTPPAVLDLIGIILERQVVLDRAAWELDLLVLARDERRRDIPEADQDGDGGEKGKENCSLQATPDFPG